uniref:Uncharacterized protein n=1 Tax=Anopheles atroparvus TaxID=41427 RepID=A0A182JCC7_ANOAO
MNSKNVSRSSNPRMPSSSVFITLFACSCSSSEVACSSLVFSSLNLANMFNRSACSSNSLLRGNRLSTGGGPHASRLGTLLLFELLPLLLLASFPTGTSLAAPHRSPSITMLRTFFSISFMSVSSSHGLTSSRMELFAIRAGFFDFLALYAARRSSFSFAASALSSSSSDPNRSTSSSSLPPAGAAAVVGLPPATCGRACPPHAERSLVLYEAM